MNANWTKSEDDVGHLQSQDYKRKFVKKLINDCNDNLFVVKRGDIQNRYLMRSIKSFTQEIKRLINLLLSIIPIITKVFSNAVLIQKKKVSTISNNNNTHLILLNLCWTRTNFAHIVMSGYDLTGKFLIDTSRFSKRGDAIFTGFYFAIIIILARVPWPLQCYSSWGILQKKRSPIWSVFIEGRFVRGFCVGIFPIILLWF